MNIEDKLKAIEEKEEQLKIIINTHRIKQQELNIKKKKLAKELNAKRIKKENCFKYCLGGAFVKYTKYNLDNFDEHNHKEFDLAIEKMFEKIFAVDEVKEIIEKANFTIKG